MGNTNFQTIHQMGTAISNMVKQATGRDDVQNIVMEHITVAQNHHYEEIDLSGQVVSFQAGEAGLPFEKMVIQIKPVQSGSGDPSTDNIRPITGWAMVNVYQAGYNMEDARVFRFPFPSEAGTVYGGALDVLTGELTVDSYEYVFTGNESWNASSTPHRFSTTISNYLPKAIATQKMNTGVQQNVISSVFGRAIYENADGVAYVVHQGDGALYVVNETSANTVSDIINIMKNSQLVYELATPITYQLTPQQITTLLGQNHIWADTGDIEVKFTNIKEMY